MKTPSLDLALGCLAAGLLLLAAPPSGRADILYVANYGNGTIEKIDSSGAATLFADTSDGLNGPVGLAFDSAGNLYASNINNSPNTVLKFTLSGMGSLFASGGSLQSPHGIAFDRAGNLYAVDSFINQIVRFSPTGTDLGVFASSGMNIPDGLAFDSAGNLYVANFSGNTIEEFSPSGTDLGAFASSGLNGPVGLAFDGAGNLYAANHGSGTIEKFSGGIGSVFATTSAGLIGLAFDSAGNLYAANDTNSIEKFSPTGADLGVFASAGLSGPQFLAFTDDAGKPLPLANQAVPEPTSAALLGLGALLLAARRRRGAQGVFPRVGAKPPTLG